MKFLVKYCTPKGWIQVRILETTLLGGIVTNHEPRNMDRKTNIKSKKKKGYYVLTTANFHYFKVIGKYGDYNS